MKSRIEKSKPSFNFNEKSIKAVKVTGKRQVIQDKGMKSLYLFVLPSGKKTFYVRKKIRHKLIDKKIGDFPAVNVIAARKKAGIILGVLYENENNPQSTGKITEKTTIKELYEIIKEHHIDTELKEGSRIEYEMHYRLYISRWANRKISAITREDVNDFKLSIFNSNGRYAANAVVKLLRALYNRAKIQFLYKGENPACMVSKYPVKSRDRFLLPMEHEAFFKALEEEESYNMKDFFYLALYLGQRKSNVCAMRFSEIDFEGRTWRIPDTKNNEPQTIPIIQEAFEILERRKREAVSDWVFPARKSKNGYMINPNNAWKKLLERAGLKNLRIHDLRRTMGSYQAISGSSLHIIGKSLGHRSVESTQIYARLHLDPVRESMERGASLLKHKKKTPDMSPPNTPVPVPETPHAASNDNRGKDKDVQTIKQ